MPRQFRELPLQRLDLCLRVLQLAAQQLPVPVLSLQPREAGAFPLLFILLVLPASTMKVKFTVELRV